MLDGNTKTLSQDDDIISVENDSDRVTVNIFARGLGICHIDQTFVMHRYSNLIYCKNCLAIAVRRKISRLCL